MSTVLAEVAWRARAAAHRRRVGALTGPHRERARTGTAHPVLDFLFTYYDHRPGRLERWHPGPGLVLAGAAAAREFGPPHRAGADGVRLDPALLGERWRRTARGVRALLVATAGRPARLGCFGLHEWAMVYRTGGERRHASTPLRLGTAGTDAVVESLPLRCTHADAYPFFSPAARPRNATAPGRADRLAAEQPGCVHATMDLYRWAYRLAPATPSELVADCLDLAVRARELDMRAGPYDLSGFGLDPVPVETPQGRAAYAAEQAGLARAAAPLRAALVDLVDLLLGGEDRPDVTPPEGAAAPRAP